MNRSRETSPEAVGGGIFDPFCPCNFWQEVENDIISGMAVDNVKFSDSRSNGFQDIRGADFMSNERTLEKPYPNSALRLKMPNSALAISL